MIKCKIKLSNENLCVHFSYYEDKSDRQRLLNVISLEFSGTRLDNYVEQPSVVSD